MAKAEKNKSAGDFDFSIGEARRFLGWLDPDAGAFDFRAIWPKEKPGAERHPPHKLRGSPDDDGLARQLEGLNEDDYGIFVTANRTDGRGVKIPNITGIREVWADIDHGMPRNFPLTPSCIVETSPGRFQAHWLVRGKMTPGEFSGVMSRIVRDYGGDSGAKDIARVLRVPGFFHTKGERFLCRIIEHTDDGSGVIDYTASELLEAFPPIEKTQAKPDKRKRAGALATLTDDFDPEMVKSALDFLPEHFGTDYNTEADEGWRNIMFAIHHGSGGSEKGWEVLDEWSRQFNGYNKARNRKLWDDAQHDRDEKIRLGTLFHFAKEYGWEQPAKTIAADIDTPTGPEKRKVQFPVPNHYGKPADHLKNVEYFITDVKGIKPWFNEFDGGYYLESYERGDRLDDAALRDLRMQMHKLDCRVSIDLMESGVKWLADQDVRHPLREKIDSLQQQWDEVRRVGRWLITYTGAKDTPFTRAVSRASLIAAIRRLRQPGALVREMPVFEGAQGVGKSTMIKIMAGNDYFSDSLPLGAEAKVVIEETAGKWIVEFPEISSKTKKEVEEIKASQSRTHDTARTAYARVSTTVPRQFVAWATTNNDRYLRDRTGNTRFWPIKVKHIDLESLRKDRDQLWAEAAHLEAHGEPHWLIGDLADAAAEETEKREVVNPIEERIMELLDDTPNGFVPSGELWKALGLDDTTAGRRTQYQLDSMGDATRKLGWRWARKRNGAGKQVPGYLAPDAAIAGATFLKYSETQNALVRVH